MRTQEEVIAKLLRLEKEVMDRIKDGHPQIRLVDSGKIEILNWVLQEDEQSSGDKI